MEELKKDELESLIKLYSLGILDHTEVKVLKDLSDNDLEFPWKELASYQNFLALIPAISDLELPSPEIKGRILEYCFNTNENKNRDSSEKKSNELHNENILDNSNIVDDEYTYVGVGNLNQADNEELEQYFQSSKIPLQDAEEETSKIKLTNPLIVTFIFFILSLIASLLVYFKLTGEIKDLREQLNQKKSTTEIILKRDIFNYLS